MINALGDTGRAQTPPFIFFHLPKYRILGFFDGRNHTVPGFAETALAMQPYFPRHLACRDAQKVSPSGQVTQIRGDLGRQNRHSS